ncbi:hypothetical protein BYT27DRAFT_6950461 [Phlegmacium glaucopus]|nr:hypothetical protein BYT27DRAFT_6950461 [Phlegmacium glaucopus]
MKVMRAAKKRKAPSDAGPKTIFTYPFHSHLQDDGALHMGRKIEQKRPAACMMASLSHTNQMEQVLHASLAAKLSYQTQQTILQFISTRRLCATYTQKGRTRKTHRLCDFAHNRQLYELTSSLSFALFFFCSSIIYQVVKDLEKLFDHRGSTVHFPILIGSRWSC